MALLAGALAGGCGYSVSGNLPANVKTVAVRVFANQTQQPNVETFITRGIVEAFSTSGILTVANPDEADTVMDGEVVGYALIPLSYNAAANVTEYRVLVTLNVRFLDVRNRRPLLDLKGVQEKGDFVAAPTVAGSLAQEETGLRQAAREIGRTVVSLAIDRF